jgi:hypothetical protein
MKLTSALATLILVAACETAPTAPALERWDGPMANLSSTSCTFDRGVTTCVATTEEAETSTHQEFSGCLAGPPPVFRPGARTRTFEDTYRVTTTLTTTQHGRRGKVIEERTSVERTLVSSRLLSDVCEPL